MCNDRIISVERMQNDETMADGKNQTEGNEEAKTTEENGNEQGNEPQQQEEEEEKPNDVQEPKEDGKEEGELEVEVVESHIQAATEDHDMTQNNDVSNTITNDDVPPNQNPEQVSFNR